VLGLFAFGDFCGVISKAKLSSVFVALMLFLIGFLTGVIPPDIIRRANLTEISKIATAFVVFNMGTSVNLSEMKREWRIVVMTVFSMIVAVGAVCCVIPFIGREAAFVSIPIINGGIVATQIMTEAAMKKGYIMAAALGTIVFAVQKFVGTIPASRCGLSEAKKLVTEFRDNQSKGINLLDDNANNAFDKPKKVKFYQKYEKYYTNYMTLGIVAVFAYQASLIQSWTGISISIWCLLLGMLVNQLGLVPPRLLDAGKSSGLFMVATFCALIPSLAEIKITDMLELGVQTTLVFSAALIGVFVALYFLPAWKFIGSRNLTIGIAMSQLLGFPATYLIVNEVAVAVGETDDEKNYIIKKLTPAFVISGFVSVTTISVLAAGIFAALL